MPPPVCIAGMHRSGTSLVAQLLHRCGLYLGAEADWLPANAANPQGFWEHRGFVTINDCILAAFGGSWIQPPELPDRWQSDERLTELYDYARKILEGFAGREPWGWKDPRNCLTLPFWQALIPELRVVVMLRHPRAVARSLQAREPSFPEHYGLELWHRYQRRIDAALGAERRIVCHFEAFAVDPEAELKRLLAFLEIDADEAVVEEACKSVDLSLMHQRSSEDEVPYGAEPFSEYAELCREAGPIYQRLATTAKRDGQPAVATALATAKMTLPRTLPISVVTPWMDNPGLIEDYERSVMGADVVVVDNGSRPENAARIRAMVERLDGTYLRNERNVGFAAANNQGLAQTTEPLILFLNNDIVADSEFLKRVIAETPAGVLAGPSLQRQLVYGLLIPYLEGWCVAAGRDAWARLDGWDAAAYPSPYWEDNDVCLRALEAGLGLQRRDWPIRHKGGQTTLSLLRWGEVLERNRAVFAARVRPLYERRRREMEQREPGWSCTSVAETGLAALYRAVCAGPSDIHQHCPTLFALARECRHVTELGTRTANSTTAFLHARPARLVCYDKFKFPQVDRLQALAAPTEFVFRKADVLKVEIEPTDLLFIDTWHVYEQLREELRLHAAKARRYIVLHDTTTFAKEGETNGHAGLWPAIEEFLARGTFRLKQRYANCHGLTVLERVSSYSA